MPVLNRDRGGAAEGFAGGNIVHNARLRRDACAGADLDMAGKTGLATQNYAVTNAARARDAALCNNHRATSDQTCKYETGNGACWCPRNGPS